MFDWNDLKYLLAVAQHGSTLAAARALKVNQSTVQRRLSELEARLGLRLVERLPRGYRLTPAGAAVLPAAEAVEGAVEAFTRSASEAANVGVLRLTCPEPIAIRLTRSGLLDRFQAQHPELRVEFVLADRYVDLSKGEADVALRSGDTDADLVGRKVADSIWAVYASRDYLRRHAAPTSVEDLRHHPLIAFDESLAHHRLSVWLCDAAPGARIAARSDSVLGLVSAVKAGVGVAALPIALGDAEPDLARVLPPIPDLTRAWRLLVDPDAAQSSPGKGLLRLRRLGSGNLEVRADRLRRLYRSPRSSEGSRAAKRENKPLREQPFAFRNLLRTDLRRKRTSRLPSDAATEENNPVRFANTHSTVFQPWNDDRSQHDRPTAAVGCRRGPSRSRMVCCH